MDKTKKMQNTEIHKIKETRKTEEEHDTEQGLIKEESDDLEESTKPEFHSSDIKDVFARLSSNAKGLTSDQVSKRLERYGRNEIKAEKKESAFKLLISQFNSPLVWILIAALVIAIAVGEIIDSIVIAAILILNAILGFAQEYRAEKAIEALQKMASLKAVVLRDGKPTKIDASELVPGDVVLLETGAKVPADCRIFELSNLETQEAALTGESTPITKYLKVLAAKTSVADRTNMIFSGTIITKGRGKAIVCSTGMKTEIGKIARDIQSAEKMQTPLQKKLAVLGKWLGLLVVVIAMIVFLTGYFLQEGSALELMLAAIALAVAAIPEGLPAVVTISLGLGVKKLVKKNALMRHLPSVETLGSTTVICSDKTGTITHNEMTVTKLFVNDHEVSVGGRGYKPEGGFSTSRKDVEFLMQIGALNNDAKLQLEEKEWKVVGDPTEGCLITAAMKAGLDKDQLDKIYPRIDELPFDSERKRMTTVHDLGNGKKHVYVKGAPDIVLDLCKYAWIDGKRVMLNQSLRKNILAKNEEFAGQALRVLAFAFKESKGKIKKEDYEKELILVGLQGMIDPPRREIKDAIARCETAGIKVVMITGDHKATAQAIAAEVGIKGRALTGLELEEMDDEAYDNIVEEVAIYARVNPAHKMKIVEALKRKGHIVAMTGDGVNDAPALKRADIGIAMGITGTDVAKEASEMILTDDNFVSIVNAVEEGRSIFDNIRKFVNYLLSCNFGEVLVIFIASLLGWPLPLIAIQLLWINLITDGLPALALGVDPASPGIMQRRPIKERRIISKNMKWNILFMGALIAVATLAAFKFGSRIDLETGRTMAFMVLVLLEIVRVQMIRGQYKMSLFSNKYLLAALAGSLALQLAVVYTPLASVFKVTALGMVPWIFMIGSVIAVYVVGKIGNKVIAAETHELY